jgi:hypothetical protein
MKEGIDYDRFQRLLEALENSDISIRLRLSGEPWRGFASVVLVSEHAMILDENGSRNMITNLRHIVEFEIDGPIFDYVGHRQYNVSY